MSTCPFCHGSGADAAKTADARKRGICDHASYIRCWNCNGNGNDPAEDFFTNRYHGPALQNLPPSTAEARRLASAWQQQSYVAALAWQEVLEQEALAAQCARMFGWLVESYWDEVIYTDVNSIARRRHA